MINKVILLGRIGSIGDYDNKAAPVRFSVATSESFKRKGSDEWETKTEWHNVFTWGEDAFKENLHKRLVEAKGRFIYVEGKMETEDYELEGVAMKSTKIKASLVRIMPKEKSDGERQRDKDEDGLEPPSAMPAKPGKRSGPKKPIEAAAGEDDLPF